MRILRFDQSNALRARPRLDLFFAGDRQTHIAEHLKMHELCNVVFLSESGDAPFLVLADAPLNVVRDPRIEYPGRAGKDVNVVHHGAKSAITHSTCHARCACREL